jgi:hypothetical protein
MVLAVISEFGRKSVGVKSQQTLENGEMKGFRML